MLRHSEGRTNQRLGGAFVLLVYNVLLDVFLGEKLLETSVGFEPLHRSTTILSFNVCFDTAERLLDALLWSGPRELGTVEVVLSFGNRV